MVFQNYALYPYLNVAANIAFPLKMAKVPKAERQRRVREAAEMLELDDYLERKPAQLSGGQRQRVAMGRAIVREPTAFLMDEPLSNLDAKLRVQMRADIAVAAGAARRDHRLRHPRPGRGDDAWATASPCCATAACSSAHPARALRPAGQHRSSPDSSARRR